MRTTKNRPVQTVSLANWPMPMKRLVMFGAGFILLLGVAVIAWVYQRDTQPQTNPGQTTSQTPEQIVEKVGRLMVLPSDEQPVIASITDADKLAREQAFYQGAKNGDTLLVYSRAQKAILYSEGLNKILNVGPVSFQGSTSTTATATKIKVELRNGTRTANLANATRDQLLKEDTNKVLDVVRTGNAVKRDYARTVIVDLSKGTVAQSALMTLAQRLNAEIKTLPTGEATSDAQVLVILGTGN